MSESDAISGKRICFVSQSFVPYPGGVSTYLYDLGKRFIKDGNDVTEVCFRPPGADYHEIIDGIEVYRIPKRIPSMEMFKGYGSFKDAIYKSFHLMKPDKGFDDLLVEDFSDFFRFNRLVAKNILRIHRDKRIDILNVHDFQLLMLGELLLKLKIPKIFTWHIPFYREVDPHIRKWVGAKLNYYDKVIFSTEEYAENAVATGVEEDKVNIIHPFVNTKVFKPGARKYDFRKRYNIPEDDKIILCVSRIDPIKGHETLIKAIPFIKKRINKFKVVFVGNGSISGKVLKRRGEKKKKIMEVLRKTGVEDDVIFTGHVLLEDIPTAYDYADVVVLPSNVEAFGLGITEGMASGKPVIGSSVGGIKTQIIHGYNGFLFGRGDSRTLARDIVAILTDRKLADNMAERSLRRAKEEYDLEVVYGRYVGLFKEASFLKIKCLVLDFDRTLVNPSNPELDEKLKESLIRLRSRNIKLIIASGRALDFMLDFKTKNPIWDAIVAENGAIVYFPQTRNTIRINEVDGKRICGVFSNARFPADIRDSTVSVKRRYERRIRQILDSDGIEANIERNVDDIMIMPRNVNKKAGIRMALGELGIEPKSCAFFGDSENDISMFTFPGLTVAMKKAHPELKKQADEVLRTDIPQGLITYLNSIEKKIKAG